MMRLTGLPVKLSCGYMICDQYKHVHLDGWVYASPRACFKSKTKDGQSPDVTITRYHILMGFMGLAL
jgi:hypothetical protein